MADVNVRDFPIELLATAKSVCVIRRMSLKALIIAAVRQYCTEAIDIESAPIRRVEAVVRESQLVDEHTY
jgi:hypothetical protein